MSPGNFADYGKMQKAQLIMLVLQQKQETYFQLTSRDFSFFLPYVPLPIYYRDGCRTSNIDQHKLSSYKFKMVIGVEDSFFNPEGRVT